MKEEIEKYLNDYDDVTINIDFLYPKEIEPYFNNVLIDIYKKEFTVSTKDKSRIKKIRDILRNKVVNHSPIEFIDDYYTIIIYRD